MNDILEKRWVTEPHNCIEESYKAIVPPCHSWIIPGIVLYPLDKAVAERIVQDHNDTLKRYS